MRFDSTSLNATARPLAALLLIQLGACAANRAPSGRSTIIHWDKQGGTLALQGDHETAKKHAQARMRAYCKGSYQVIRIDRVKVGESTTYSGTSKSRTNVQPADSVVPDRSVTNENQVTTVADVYETQVEYVCMEPAVSGAPQVETEPPEKPR